MMNILYIAYSCNPFAGSEDKIGWCVPYESSKTNKVYVITKEEQREPVEKYLQSHPLENIKFYYVDIPNFYKKIFKGFMYSGRLNVWNSGHFPAAANGHGGQRTGRPTCDTGKAAPLRGVEDAAPYNPCRKPSGHPVGAGHARPATYRQIPFTVNP